jgi:hypothetical protein
MATVVKEVVPGRCDFIRGRWDFFLSAVVEPLAG